MGAEDNIKTVKRIYEAFGRGDVGTILDCVTDDVDWASEAASGSAPWWGVRHGKDATTGFFESLGATMATEEFTPIAYATTDDGDVLTVVRFRTRAIATGKTAAMDLHHYFRFTEGKISYYRGTEDTEQTAAALRA